MHELIARLVDRSEFDEYKPDYGRTVLCGYARIGGFAVGIVANQKQHQPHTSHTGEKRVEFGGVIYAESADKAARFILDCNQNLIPLIFIHDVNGFMVGRDAEWTGIIRSGAKMVAAVANSTVPKITVIVGGSFGAGNYAMCGKAYDPRFIFAWPTARYAVMSGASAAGTLVEIRIRTLERGGHKLSDEEKQEIRAGIQASYDAQTDSATPPRVSGSTPSSIPQRPAKRYCSPSKPPPTIQWSSASTPASCKLKGLLQLATRDPFSPWLLEQNHLNDQKEHHQKLETDHHSEFAKSLSRQTFQEALMSHSFRKVVHNSQIAHSFGKV